jgi:hypothetical protein
MYYTEIILIQPATILPWNKIEKRIQNSTRPIPHLYLCLLQRLVQDGLSCGLHMTVNASGRHSGLVTFTIETTLTFVYNVNENYPIV